MKTDLHTHTVASGHAFGTVLENAKAAKAKGIELIACTDHGPSVQGTSQEIYFRCFDRLPREFEGVKILFGVEANVMDNEGHLDLPDSVLKNLDVVIVGLHMVEGGYVNQGIEKNTEVLIKVMDNPYVKMISHPYWSIFEVDMVRVTEAAIAKNILLEINAAFFFIGHRLDEHTLDKMRTMIKILKDHGQKIIINSDAHNPYEVGRFEEVIARFEELGLNNDDILNNDLPAVLKFFGIAA